MAQYFRITAYHPEQDVSIIIDSNGMFEKLWQFSATLVSKGFKVLEASSDGQFNCGNIDKCEEVSDKILLRSYSKGMPTYSGNTVEVSGMFYTPNKSNL